jgi:predicted amidohydrolase YtcJ
MVLGCQFQYDALGVAPHKGYLDAVLPTVPVIIECSCYHSAWLNSAAVAAVGISASTRDPTGGEIVRRGWPHGFKETAGMEFVWPYIAQTSVSQRVELLARCLTPAWL